MEAIKWAGLAVLALFVFSFFRRGGLTASLQAQANPPGWGSGMLYSPGASYGFPGVYGYPMQPSGWSFGGSVPTDNGGGFSFYANNVASY